MFFLLHQCDALKQSATVTTVDGRTRTGWVTRMGPADPKGVAKIGNHWIALDKIVSLEIHE